MPPNTQRDPAAIDPPDEQPIGRATIDGCGVCISYTLGGTTIMQNYPADADIVSQIETVRLALPTWVISTVELVELAENAERAAVHSNADTLDRSRKLIVEVAEWQQKLTEWQAADLSPRLKAELRILKATLDASMDEANGAAAELHLFD